MKALLSGIVLLSLGYLISLSVTRKPGNDNIESVDSVFMERGELVYKENCLSCHQKDGSGVPAMYPPLTNNPNITGPKDTMIKVMLEGKEGPLTINGQYYNAQMPAYDHLSNEDIAAVLTFVRKSFGNQAEAIKPADVRKLRKKLKG